MRYDAVNAMLLNEFLKAHRKVMAVESGVTHLAASLKEQDSKIQMLSAQLAAASPCRGGLELSKPGRLTVLNNQ